MDDSLEELLGVNHKGALEFFFVGLRDVARGTVDQQELLYNASILAHYAQISTVSDGSFPSPANLSFVFDHFVCGSTLCESVEMLETAGAQCLFLAGFFEDQMRTRHNIEWYTTLGAGFFRRAATYESHPKKSRLFEAIGRRFEPWRQTHARLGRYFRDRPYLIRPAQL